MNLQELLGVTVNDWGLLRRLCGGFHDEGTGYRPHDHRDGRASGDIEQLLNNELAGLPTTSRIMDLCYLGTVPAWVVFRSVN
jgi:hypothetical protein